LHNPVLSTTIKGSGFGGSEKPPPFYKEDEVDKKTHSQILEGLTKEFGDEAVHRVSGPGGQMFDYIKAHYVIDRLIKVLGLEWSATTIGGPIIHTDPVSGTQWITMGVRFSMEIDGKVWEKRWLGFC